MVFTKAYIIEKTGFLEDLVCQPEVNMLIGKMHIRQTYQWFFDRLIS